MHLLLLLLACSSGDPADDTGAADDTGGTDDTGDAGPQPAPLAELSSGACPDLSASGTSTFLSSGEERQVTVVIPAEPGEDMSVNFFFHGLTDPSYTDNPGGDTVAGLDLQAVADDTNSVWIAPDAPVQDLYGMFTVYLWDLGLATDHDLVLFDDLRTCVAQTFSVDLKRVNALGFSGGALFTTVVAANRSDTLASAVEMSGGSDLEIPGQKDLWSKYQPLVNPLPVLLSTGGDDDVWPSAQFVVVDFEAASDTLQGELLADGGFVVRCHDDRGHAMTNPEWKWARQWAEEHVFGEPSPFLDGDLSGNEDWCAVAQPK